MKRLAIFLLLSLSGSSLIKAQCLQIESILVDACVPGGGCVNNASPTCNCEGKNEMVIFKVGSTALNVSSLTITWPNNSFQGWHTPDAQTASNVSTLNATIAKCGYLKEPVGGVLPANAEVLIVGSVDMCTTANSFANLQDTLIVIFQNSANFQGHFANTTNGAGITTIPSGASSIRSTTLSYPPLTCSETVSYDRSLLVNVFGTYGGTASQNDGSTVQFDALGNATYVNYGCQAPYIPIIVKVGTGGDVCYNGSINITGTVAGPYTSYSWSGGTGTFGNPTSLNTTYSPGSGDVGSVTLYLTAIGKCSMNVVKDSVMISITPAPTPTVTSNFNSPQCAGSPVVLSVNNQTGTTYSWSPGAGSTSSFTVNPMTQTVYTLAATNSCTTTNATFTVDVIALPVVAVVNDSVCPGANATLTASGANTYTWSSGANGSSLSDNPTSTTQYTVSGTDGNGCVNSATGEIFIYTPSTISVTSVSVCPGATATLTASGANTYTWNTSATGSSLSDSPSSTTQYTATGTDAHGCNNTGTGEIFIYTPATVTANSPSVCPGSTATLTAGGANTYTWSTTQNGVSISVTPSVTTTYTVSGTDANGCDNSTTATVNIYNLPVIGVNSPNICPGNSAVLNASGAVTYTWSTGSTASSITVTPGANTSYTVTGTDANGCVNDTVSTVSIVNTLTVTATPANTTVCSGSPTALTGNGASTYTWSPVSSLNTSTGTSVIASPTVTTTYTVIGSSGTCSDTNVVTVNVNPLPVVTANSATICAGNTTVLTAHGANTYSWSPATGLSSTTGSVVTANPIIICHYTVTGMDGNNCQDTAVATVIVNPTPTITVNNPAICTGVTGTLTASGASTYTWSTAQTGATITVNPGTNTSYTVSGTDTNGCVNSSVATVTVNALPTVSGNDTSVCGGSAATLTANGANTYTWSTSQTGSSINVSPSSNTQYTVTGTDNNGCSNSAVLTVTVDLLPNVGSSNASACAGAPVILTSNGAITYTWSTSQNGPAIAVSPTVTTSYTVVGTAANGCTNSSVSTVTVLPSPVITCSNVSICAGTTATLTAGGAQTYTWSTSQTGSPVTVSPTINTGYTVTGTGSNGCSGSAVAVVTVSALPNVTVNSPTVCANANATLIAGGASTYTWSSNQTGSSISVPGTAASYTVTGTDANGCQAAAVSTVSVMPLPTAQSVSGNTLICNGQTDVLSVTTPGAYSYTWSGPGGITGSGTSVVVTQAGVYTLTTGNSCGSIATQFTVAVSTPQAGFTPNVGSAYVPATFVFTNSSSGTQLANYWNFSNGDTSMQMNPAETYTASGTYTVTLVVMDQYGCLDTAVHTVLVADVPVPMVVPNVFSPNGDGINDVFTVSGKNVNDFNCKIYDRWGLMMYEWNGINGGWNGQNSKNGAAVSDGTYYYIISYTDNIGTQNTKRGYLQLVR